jgi:putative ABC transport system permease protein
MNWHAEITAEFTRRHKKVDDGVVEEMAQHAASAWEAARADGMSASEADASVRALVSSWCEGTSGPRRIERSPLLESAPAGSSLVAGLGLDLRLAARLLRRQPGFAFASALMIALGIGATTSLFSLVNGVLLKPLPWRTADRLIRVYDTTDRLASNNDPGAMTNVVYHAWRDQPQTIDGIAAWSTVFFLVPGDGGIDRVPAAMVTAGLFPLLGASPILGSTFTEADERPDNTLVLSYGFWRERFGGATDVIGKTMSFGGRTRTIVGVMPGDFEFPTRDVRFWTPLFVPLAYRDGNLDHSVLIYNGLARLKPGATPTQAASEAEARLNTVPPPDLISEMVNMTAATGRLKVTTIPMLDSLVKDVRLALWILLAAGGLLFAAAIGTVVTMQLAQATARRREIAIRAALGAGASRIARQLFVETTTLSAIGGALGLLLAFSLLRLLLVLLPQDFPRLQHIAIDPSVLAVAAALTMIVSLTIGLLPARIGRRLGLIGALTEDGSAPVGQSLRSPAARSRAFVITAQVAIAAVLLVGASLLSRSFIKLLASDRGYTPANLLTARIGFAGGGQPPAARMAFYTQTVERLMAIGGVAHAGITNSLPLTPANPRTEFRRDKSQGPEVRASTHLVTPGYFGAMGIRLISGRDFSAGDTVSSEPVTIVNETFARAFLRGDPLDARLPAFLDEERRDGGLWRVVGVVADVRHRSPFEPLDPEMYAPMTQMTRGPVGLQYLTVRTTGDASALAADLRTIVRGVSSNGVVDQVMTMETRLMWSLARPRLYALLLGGFSTFALLIAVIGLFGGLSYGVTQRTREIGVRTALGATPRDIMRLVMVQGTAMTVAGLVIGFGVAAATVRYLAAFLFGVEPLDPTTFVTVGASLMVVAIVACAIPARRAARIDPILALKR